MSDQRTVSHYPLEWPLGWRRSRGRRTGMFRKEKRAISVEDATRRLERELEKLKVTNETLSTNLRLNLRGFPRGDENPGDPGAAIYFSYKGKATVLACDTYFRVADNIAALAAHLEALRAIERYGVGTIEQALAGYKALPADTAADWRSALAVPPEFDRWSRAQQIDVVQKLYHDAARRKHPDAGGSDVEMAWLNRARDYALQELEGR